LKRYQNLDFVRAQQKALDHLGRFFSVRKADDSEGQLTQGESWIVELEVDGPEDVICLDATAVLLADFPLSLPYIYIPEEEVVNLGFPPNISTKGEICTFDRETTIPDPENPGELLEICVRRAKRIIQEGLKSDFDKYNTEFIAYWENQYRDEDSVDMFLLSLIDETGDLPKQVTYVLLKDPIGKFHSFLYSEKDQFDPVKRFLNRTNMRYIEFSTFHLGQLQNLYPPFHMRNGDVKELIEKIGLGNKFKEYLESEPPLPCVTFTRMVDDRNLVFGWLHKPVEIRTRNRGKKIFKIEKKLSPSRYYTILANRNRSVPVERFSPQVFTQERLIRRTSADYIENMPKKGSRVLVAGLGSVGSNLIPFLESANIIEFSLIDPDTLSLDNIKRHLLGLTDVGKNKAEAMRDHLQRKNPLIPVHIRTNSLVQIILQEPEFLSNCDYYFFCTGDVNSEMWVVNNMADLDWNRPAFFLWVEPYLAGGHCIFFNGIDKVAWETLFVDHKFVHNIISNQVHDAVDFAKREAGCQITFLPYSAANLNLFLAALFPKIFGVLTKGGSSRCFSWVGDLDILKAMDIRLSKHAESLDSFSLIERSIC
jgi:hypothetical protein